MKTLAKILALFEVWLAKPRAPWFVVALVVLILLPSLRTGWSSDDFVRRALDRRAPIALGSAPADYFDFASGRADDAARLRDDGVFPWWADSSAKLHFFRPLASLSHAVDHALWPESALGEHAQSIAWYLALIGAVWLLLRRSPGPRWLATFTLLLFALDDTHGAAIGWIASRNTIMCAVFGFLALGAHLRWRREGWRAGAVVAPLCFAVAMGCGEAGVATFGYLVAFAFFLDEGTRAERLTRLLPYAALVAAFAVVYVLGSFGAKHSTQYIDPAGEPGRFAAAVAVRLPVYLHGLLSGPPSDFWIGYGVLNPALPYIMWAFAVASVGGFLWVAWPILAPDRELRFWLAGAVLAAVPACAGFPSNRPLVFASLGIMVVIGRFVVAVARGAAKLYPTKGKRVFAMVNAGWLFASSVPISVLTLKMTSSGTSDPWVKVDHAAAALPHDAAIADKTLVLIDAPMEPMLFYLQYARAAAGEVRPAHTRLLATTGYRALTVERIDERTLRVRGDKGLLERNVDMMLRSPAHNFAAGDTVELSGLHVQIEQVTEAGVPSAVRFQFDRPLEDPALVWMSWDGTGFVRFTPPAPGTSVTLPAFDLAKLFMGS